MNILNLRPFRFRVAVLLLVPLLTIAFLSPAMAERPGNRAKRSNARMQRKAPQRAQRPAPTVQRRQRSQVTRSPQRRQVTRSPQRQQRQQVTRSPQRQQRRQVTRSPQRQQRQQVTRNSQPRQQQRFTNSPRRQERQKMTRSPQRQERQKMTRSPQRQERQKMTRGPQRQEMTRGSQRQERQKMTRGPQRQERQEMTRGSQRQERQKMTRGPQREERQKMTRGPQRQERQEMTRGPQRQERQKMTRGPQRQERQTNRPQRDQGDRDQRLDNRGPNRGYANRNQRPGRNANGVSFTRPGRIDTRKTRPAQQVVRQPITTGARRGGTANFNRNYNANVNQNQNYNYNYNQNVNVNRNVVVSQPATYTYAAPNVCPPAYSVVNNYNPYAYANYCDRRDYRRRYRNNCSWPLLMLGFFISRPYSSYDYARVDYNNQPYFYGDDTAYQASPIAVGSEGGPVAATPNFDSKEEQMLVALSEHVQASSVDGAYQISDAAFNGQLWNLDLAQAPAVFEIQDGLYSVVAGFEGTLGAGDVPSNVNVEFFIARTANGYEVRDAWITSANGIPRNRLYQSPVYPDVSTWEPGRLCPFTGQEMVPMEAHTSEHG